MKHLFFLLLSMMFVSKNFAQSIVQQDLTSLSREFQRIFCEKGWILDAPMSYGGLDFSHGPTFSRMNAVVQWSNNDYASLTPLIKNSEHIQDSMIYMMLGVYDHTFKKQIIDIYSYQHVNSEGFFPNPGRPGEFRGGIEKFSRSLSAYLDTTINNLNQQKAFIKFYFSNSTIAICSDHQLLQQKVNKHFAEHPIKYSPGIRFGRLGYNYQTFEVTKIDSNFVVKQIDSGEPIFCYKDTSTSTLIFIEPHFHKSKMGNLTFVYDKKWSEEEFLNSDHIIAIRNKIDSPQLVTALKDFHRNEIIPPFSAMYSIHIEHL